MKGREGNGKTSLLPGYFEEDVLFTYDTFKRRSHFYEDVADSIHMLQRRSGFHAIFTKT